MIKKNKGFTLVELAIVISVIAILSAVLIPTFSGIIARAKESARLQQVAGARDEYVTGNKEITSKEDMENYVIKVDNIYYGLDKTGKVEYIGPVIDDFDENYTEVFGYNSNPDVQIFKPFIEEPELPTPSIVTFYGGESYEFEDLMGTGDITVDQSNTITGFSDYVKNNAITMIIPKNIQIGEFVFQGFSRIEEVTIQKGITQLGNYSFYCCDPLIRINLPDTIQSICDYAFRCDRYLEGINIPKSVTYITSTAFEYCDNLSYLTVDPLNPVYDSRNNCNAIIETATNTLVVGCSSTVIPNDIVTIGDGAFWGVMGDFTSVTIPSSVREIEYRAFNQCYNLETVVLNEGLEIIGGGAFEDCDELTTVYIPSTVNSIASGAFEGSYNIETIVIDINNETYFSQGYEDNELVNYNGIFTNHYEYKGEERKAILQGFKTTTLPSDLEIICASAFRCIYTYNAVEIPESVIYIGGDAFTYTNIRSLYIPKNVEFIANEIVTFTPLEEIIVDRENTHYFSGYYDGDDYIECNVIYGMTTAWNENGEYEINSVISACQNSIMPEGVERIGYDIFWGVRAPRDVIVPSSVTVIDRFILNSSGANNLVIKNPNGTYNFYDSSWYDLENICFYGSYEEYEGTNLETFINDNFAEYIRFYTENTSLMESLDSEERANYWHFNNEGEVELWSETLAD